MDSFYGGPKGQDFKIKKIFHSKVEMQADIEQRWQSSIGVGEYVIISYGLQTQANTDQYKAYEDADFAAYGNTYNATLWQKIYSDDGKTDGVDELTGIETLYVAGAQTGLGYKLISSMKGSTPLLDVRLGAVLNADEDPYLVFNNENANRPYILLYLPQSQVSTFTSELLLGDQDPEFFFNNEVDASGNPVHPAEYDINNPWVNFKFPRAIKWDLAQANDLFANQAITIDDLNNLTSSNPDTYTLSFHLPKATKWEASSDTTLDADQAVGLDTLNTLDASNPDTYYLKFHFPKNERLMVKRDIDSLDPAADPYATYTNTGISGSINYVNTPELELHLPRGIKFYYGNELGEKSASSYPLPNTNNYGVGDYYVNIGTGFIYEITAVPASGDCTAVFRARLQASKPEVAQSPLSAYKLEGSSYVKNVPAVVSTYDNATEQTGWNLTFKLPNIPDFDVKHNDSTISFCGVDETPSGNFTGQPTGINEYGIYYDLTIPRGSKIFTGNAVTGTTISSVVVTDAKPGDTYLNSDDGNYYVLVKEVGGNLNWHYKLNLRGPIGNPIEFGSSTISITDTEVPTFSDAAIGTYLMNPSGGGLTALPTPYQVIPVNYTDSSGVMSYYFLYRDNKWSSVLLSGDAATFASTTSADDNNKAYSITYINGLVKDLSWGTFAALTAAGGGLPAKIVR